MRRGQRKTIRVGALAAMVLVLICAGCMGPGPVERTLVVLGGCPGQPSGAPSQPNHMTRSALPIVAVLPFEASAALDRRAVAIQEGSVLRSATTWSWEDTPRRMVTQAVLDQLACSGAWGVLWPYRPRGEHLAVLGGRVDDFSVALHPQGGEVRVALTVDVWSAQKGPLLGRLPVQATAPCADATPQAVAVAAQEALRDAMRQVEQGLQTLRPRLEDASE